MGSFKIASVYGIPVRIHFTFLLILPFLAFVFGNALRQAALLAEVPPEAIRGSPWIWGLAIALTLFLSVLVHELAHSLYAIRRGGQVKDITLLMIGGVSQLEKPPKERKQEAIMALAGPVTSIGIGLLFFGAHRLSAATDSFNLQFALFYVGFLNIFLGLFNLLPAFPMDGGRILRSLLAGRMGMIRATNVASTVGRVFALLFAAFGLISFNFFLLLIAFFVYVGATGEAQQVIMHEALRDLRVRDVMAPRTSAVDVTDDVASVVARMVDEKRLALPAIEAGEVIGIVPLEAIQRIPQEQRSEVGIRSLVRRVEPVSPDAEIETIFRQLAQSGLPQLPVVEHGRLIGTITTVDIGRAIELRKLERPITGWTERERHA